MIRLTLFPSAFGEPSASPFCMKSYCMMKAAGLPFEVIETNDPRKSPKGKLPFIESETEQIADSEQIRGFIETVADIDFDEILMRMRFEGQYAMHSGFERPCPRANVFILSLT